jgi:hypothetical protein
MDERKVLMADDYGTPENVEAGPNGHYGRATAIPDASYRGSGALAGSGSESMLRWVGGGFAGRLAASSTIQTVISCAAFFLCRRATLPTLDRRNSAAGYVSKSRHRPVYCPAWRG